MNVLYVHQRPPPAVTFDIAEPSARDREVKEKEREEKGKGKDGKEEDGSAADFSSSDLCYDLTFTSAELKSEYASQPNKVKQFATLKRIPIRRIADHRINTATRSTLDPFTVTATTSSPLLSPAMTPQSSTTPSGSPTIGSATVGTGTSTISFDVDLALDDLYKAMEAERAVKQKRAREEPSKAYHLLDLKQRKEQTYQLVIQQVHDMALALLRFQCNEKTSSSLPSPTSHQPASSSSSTALSAIDGFSLDAPMASSPPTQTPTFSRSHTDQPAGLESIDESPPPQYSLGLSHAHSMTAAPDLVSASPPPPAIIGPLQSRVNDLRSWVTSYQRFRSWQTANQPFSSSAASPTAATAAKQSNPVDAIKLMLRENVDPEAILDVARLHEDRARSRTIGLQLLWDLFRAVSFEVGRVEVVGLLVDALTPSLPDSGTVAVKGTDGEEKVSVFSGIECATAGSKLEVNAKYEQFALALLDLLKQPLPSTRPQGSKPSALSNPAVASSPLVLSSSVAGTRLNYASRLLALSDVYSFPFAPVLGSSSLLSSHGVRLFQVLSDAVVMKRLMGQIEGAIAKDTRRKDAHLVLSLSQQEQRDKEIADAEAAAQQRRLKVQSDGARKQTVAAEVAATELLPSNFFAILDSEGGGDWTLAGFFDDNEEKEDASSAAAPQAPSAEVADTRRMCRYGLDCFRRNPAHFIEFRHPVRNSSSVVQKPTSVAAVAVDSPLKDSVVEAPSKREEVERRRAEREAQVQAQAADADATKAAEEAKAQEDNESGREMPPAHFDDQNRDDGDDDFSASMAAIVNRMGRAKTSRDSPANRSQREDEARKAKERRIFMRMSAADRDRNRRAMGLTGSAALWLDEEEGEADEKEGEIPSVEYVESVLSSYQWAALRVLLVVKLTAYGPADHPPSRMWKAT